MSPAENESSRPGRLPSNQSNHETSCCAGPNDCNSGDSSRREFLKLAAASTASLISRGSEGAETSSAEVAPDHFVPIDKKLDPTWLRSLTAKGESTWYEGGDLDTIAMPIGGICAGQVYLAGDGRLMHWDIFNKRNFTGYGHTCYDAGQKPVARLKQGFAVKIESGDDTFIRSLDHSGFPAVRFCGEYPIGTVDYADDKLPVAITLEAFSPFIPLNTNDSALPATLMQFRLKNTSNAPATVTLAGWLENAVCDDSAAEMLGTRVNRIVKRNGMMMIAGSAKPVEAPQEKRPPIVFEDFEHEGYAPWTVEGEAFGDGPAHGTLANQQDVSGFAGKGFVNTYLGGDDRLTGKLTSPAFKVERNYISFLIGGGELQEKTCINLLIDDKVALTAVGKKEEKLIWHNWNVAGLIGKEARIEIVDQETGPWGHINIDRIEFRDVPRSPGSGTLQSQPDFGTMGLALIDAEGETFATASLPAAALHDMPEPLFADDLPITPDADAAFGRTLCGALAKQCKLAPGEEARVTFVAAWCFPNRPQRGNRYAEHFNDATEVASYVAENLDRLAELTRLWHDTWYDSTLPHWLLDRLFSTVSTLATSTCQWWANGRFWAWEGVGCCHGTCAHVWNYEHAMARLFPELERSCREMQDFGTGFVEETGMVSFRGEGWGKWAADSQAGTVLKAYREHQVSADRKFLERNWKKIRKTLEFLIGEDANDDGLIEGRQHNTYDIDFYGANTMAGSLYLAALLAAEQMAVEIGDTRFAATCRRLFDSGSRLSIEQLFNGEYFIQQVDLQEHPKAQYGEGCLADQLFGQGWAHQVGLGYVFPEDIVKKTLAAIWKYNWAPDVARQNAAHKPERWFARAGEAGLFTCTWPKTKHLPAGVRYKNEVWTGIEYQVAGNMAFDGMVTEALAICRAIDQRYHPSKRNPFNEVECGDHYARAMASYGVFIGLCGFQCHGPKGHVGFSPRITPRRFRAAFTTAEAWGTLSQEQTEHGQADRFEVKWGRLTAKTLSFDLPDGVKLQETSVVVAGAPCRAAAKQDGRRVTITLDDDATIGVGQEIAVEMTTAP